MPRANVSLPASRHFIAEWTAPPPVPWQYRGVLDTWERVILYWPQPGTRYSRAVVATPTTGVARAGCFYCPREHDHSDIRCTLDPTAGDRLRSGAVALPSTANHVVYDPMSRQPIGSVQWMVRPQKRHPQSCVRVYSEALFIPAHRY